MKGLISCLVVAMLPLSAVAQDREYDELYIAVETSPSSYPCQLTVPGTSGERGWNGEKSKPYSNTVTSCQVQIPKKEFLATYEVCFLSGIRLPDHNLSTHTYCSYSYPNFFTAEIGKVADMEGINSILCKFVCKVRQ